MFVIAEVIKKISLAWATSPTRVDADYLAVKLPMNLELFVSMEPVQHMAWHMHSQSGLFGSLHCSFIACWSAERPAAITYRWDRWQ